MRTIRSSQIIVFLLLFAVALLVAVLISHALDRLLRLGDFRSVVLIACGAVVFLVALIAVFRLFLRLFPLLPGDVPAGSRQEFVYHVYLLFFLIFFYPIMRGGITPVPLMRLFYLALGAKLGANTYASGILLDPMFIELGHDTLVGQYSLLVPHVIEGTKLGHYPIRVGNHVTIGAGAIVLSGVSIGDDAIVSTGAVVTKGTRIAHGEIWGGVPAKCIGTAKRQ